MPIDFSWMFYAQQAINEASRKDNRPVKHRGRGSLRLEEMVFSIKLHLLRRESQAKILRNFKVFFSYVSHEFNEKFQSLYLKQFFITVKHLPAFCRSCFQ